MGGCACVFENALAWLLDDLEMLGAVLESEAESLGIVRVLMIWSMVGMPAILSVW